MSDKKNIDRLFQEKFKDFENVPSDAVWERINESLHNKKKKRRVIPLWWQIGGVAAIIALLLTIGISIYNPNNNPHNTPIVDTDQNDSNKETKNKGSDSTSKHNQSQLKTNENKGLAESESSQDSSEQPISTDKITPNRLGSPNHKSSQQNAVADHNKRNTENKKSTPQKNNGLIESPADVNKSVVSNSTNNNTSDDSPNKLKTDELKSVVEQAKESEKNAVVTNSKSGNKTKKEASKEKEIQDKSEKLLEPSNKKESIEDALASNETNDEEEKEEERNRWSIAPNVAPVYFSSLGNGSSLDNQFAENTKNGDINMSYGITGSYAVSKRLKVRVGVNRVDLNQTTSNVLTFTSTNSPSGGVEARLQNINFTNPIQAVSMISSESLNKASTPEIFNAQRFGKIDQRFGFIEVPMELEYRLLDTKFGINVIGGFSTLFLNNNEIYADVDGTSTLIGEANNIRSTSFSANFGFGLDYSLSRRWNINLEPTFKYQLNTFNNTTANFRPFFIGVYTGLSFKF